MQHSGTVSTPYTEAKILWLPYLSMAGAAGFAFLLYFATAAPGLTWAHHGADGGELLAAALTNGVPHPPGYPLYMMLLQGWLWLGAVLWPGGDPAWLGSLFSITCAALSSGVTVRVAAHFLYGVKRRWLWALITGIAWTTAPLPWSQALITEVYALHMLLVALLGWALFVKRKSPYWLVVALMLGTSHHLTFILLLPAVLYYLWFVRAQSMQERWQYVGYLALGGLLGLLFFIRTPLAAASALPSPVNWGYPDNWEGFWWLVSGAAYRGYLFGAPSSTLLMRIAAWASTLTNQLTPVGLALMLIGLSHWDRQESHLRNFSLLWLTPISIYAINYYTRDSEIYLLPVVWLAMLWFGVGLATLQEWLQSTWAQQQPLQNPSTAQATSSGQPQTPTSSARTSQPDLGALLLLLTLVGLMGLTGWRWTTVSARNDFRAQYFLQETISVLEPHSIVVSSADAETFALWYGAWGSGELLHQYPDTVLINYALYQFPWYRRLLMTQYPDVVQNSASVEEILALNQDRPIFFSEEFSFWPAEQMQPVGPIWRYVAPE
ncbi:MAG: DUF2723 domain-containing protein [Caldilineaceae bacterium]